MFPSRRSRILVASASSVNSPRSLPAPVGPRLASLCRFSLVGSVRPPSPADTPPQMGFLKFFALAESGQSSFLHVWPFGRQPHPGLPVSCFCFCGSLSPLSPLSCDPALRGPRVFRARRPRDRAQVSARRRGGRGLRWPELRESAAPPGGSAARAAWKRGNAGLRRCPSGTALVCAPGTGEGVKPGFISGPAESGRSHLTARSLRSGHLLVSAARPEAGP